MEDFMRICFHHGTLKKTSFHFAAMQKYSYGFFCIRCGHHPPILVSDANCKLSFDIPKTQEMSYNVINLSNEQVTKPALEVLSKGVSFIPMKTADTVQLQIDLYKFTRNLKLKKFFLENPIRSKKKEPNVKPAEPSELSIMDIENILTLANLDNTDPIDIPTLIEDLQIPMGLTEDSKLKKRSKFVPSFPKGNSIDKFAATVSKKFSNLNSQQKNWNLTKEQNSALEYLRKNKNLTIKEADKGGSVVVMNSTNYSGEIKRQLSDVSCYQRLRTNPTVEHSEILKLLTTARSEGIIDEDEFEYLYVTDPVMAVIYILPKVHKPFTDFPSGRPIISGCGSLSEKLSEYIDEYLIDLVETLPSYLKDTASLLTDINEATREGGLLVTLDVVSLYTCIRHQDGLKAVSYFLKNSSVSYSEQNNFILTAFQFILEHNTFLFEGEFFIQKRGTAMGTRFARSYANLFMGWYEREHAWSPEAEQWYPKVLKWSRYIDDVILFWKGSESELLAYFAYLNNNSVNIKFTIAYSANHISYLDVEIYIEIQQQL